jgi:hypothetical protein
MWGIGRKEQWLSERLGQQFIIENRPGGDSASTVKTETRILCPSGHRALDRMPKAVYRVGRFLRVTSLPRAQRFCRLVRHTLREAPHQPPNRPLWRRVGGAP